MRKFVLRLTGGLGVAALLALGLGEDRPSRIPEGELKVALNPVPGTKREPTPVQTEKPLTSAVREASLPLETELEEIAEAPALQFSPAEGVLLADATEAPTAVVDEDRIEQELMARAEAILASPEEHHVSAHGP